MADGRAGGGVGLAGSMVGRDDGDDVLADPMTQEHMRVDLASGGWIDLLVDVKWLHLSMEDLKFVRGLVASLRAYGAEPAIGVDVGDGGGGGGSEPPPPPPESDEQIWRSSISYAPLGSPPGPLLLAGMVASLVEGEGDANSKGGASPSHPEPVALDAQGLPTGYRCDYCERVLATLGGKNRHMTVAHNKHGLTRAQLDARSALSQGDPGRYRNLVGADGLVACGVDGCAERRGLDVIGRHRLAHHGAG